MGSDLPLPEGLSSQIRKVTYDRVGHTLERITEVSVIGEPGNYFVPDHAPTWIRAQGLKIGMQFRGDHTVGATPVEFTAGTKGQSLTTLPPFMRLNDQTQAPTVTTQLTTVFGAQGQWKGYFLTPAQLSTLPIPANPRDEALFFRVTIGGFHPGRLQFHVVPVVVALGNFDFDQHYVLSLGVFTTGGRRHTAAADMSEDFDVTVLAWP
jgi:hypothetical protein